MINIIFYDIYMKYPWLSEDKFINNNTLIIILT